MTYKQGCAFLVACVINGALGGIISAHVKDAALAVVLPLSLNFFAYIIIACWHKEDVR